MYEDKDHDARVRLQQNKRLSRAVKDHARLRPDDSTQCY